MKNSGQYQTAQDIPDQRGYLKYLLGHGCPGGKRLAECPLLEWRRRNHIEMMVERLVGELIERHLRCANEPKI